MQTITLGGGCFWCVESALRAMKGIEKVTSGYAGGSADTANYDAVCTGNTAHVEVVEVVYDDAIMPTETLLRVFFTLHDPTTLNSQGNDVGTQYASVIFHHTNEQKLLAETVINDLKNEGIPVVTKLAENIPFYKAEDYHQDYFTKNPTQGYCMAVIPPKLAKLRKSFSNLYKD